MAISTFNQGTPLANTLVYQSDGTSTGDDGILTSGSTVFSIVVDNSANSGTGGDVLRSGRMRSPRGSTFLGLWVCVV